MTTIRNELARPHEGLPSVEKACAMLAHCRDVGEIRKIRAIAQAVATMERGKEIACDAGEIIVMADTRRAELEREEKDQRPEGRPKKSVTGRVTVSHAQIVAEGKRKPLLALPDEDRRRYFTACRKILTPATPSGAAALAKLPAPERRRAIATLEEVVTRKDAVPATVRKAIRDAEPESDEVRKGRVHFLPFTAKDFSIEAADSFFRLLFAELCRIAPQEDLPLVREVIAKQLRLVDRVLEARST